MGRVIDSKDTDKTRARYNRIAPVYDLMEILPERHFVPWRKKLWSLIPGGRVLEVGVGTGKNFPYHPAEAEVTGIDLSERMLAQARRKANRLGRPRDLRQMDTQQLDFADDSLDAATATFVFCSVPDPVQGLRELARVVKPQGRIVLLEHVRIDRPGFVGKLMDLLDPVVVRLIGAHINRRTASAVRQAGLVVEREEDLAARGLVKLIVARPSLADEADGGSIKSAKHPQSKRFDRPSRSE
jgi:phosphatidylethanolamine/phosphatidyl-N-methylethanolamine N-methyltransferase